ncbi:hypothetical protein SYNPS1DRAFT_29979 [Syncephalis pseudoplumigaleata]|uniref:Uncharacterized protein n=1 Tax=Syncephalis pseudoplumigaleata TaxID=1712513 RepID=A0A4P9YW26_9FUNG|nr:hypothetical protein SYNPS1DRAFT_29979 [Syncephalis pseudoplumigaleata]|eukprot:RKP24256.1 hypothetical protein SYNPS1DRAFT_29979 [Syncephalis pseudoplumigaleata]
MWWFGDVSYSAETAHAVRMGQFNAVQYLEEAGGNVAELRTRMRGIAIQLVITTSILYLFVRNAWHAVRMLCARHTLIPAWCCLVQSLMGISFACLFLSSVLPGGPSCHTSIRYASLCLMVSVLAVSTTLLHKAYLAHQRSRLLLAAGVVLMLPQPLPVYIVWRAGHATMDPESGCSVALPACFPWLKFGLDAALIVAFSAAFITVVYRHYRLFGSEAWRRLAEDGTRTMCLIILSNAICLLASTFHFPENAAMSWWLADW